MNTFLDAFPDDKLTEKDRKMIPFGFPFSVKNRYPGKRGTPGAPWVPPFGTTRAYGSTQIAKISSGPLKWAPRGTELERISRPGDPKNHKNWAPVGEMYYKID